MKKILLAITILIIPLILISAHTVYVAELNDFDDSNMKKLEKRLNNNKDLTKHFEGKLKLKYVKKSNAVNETHIYELVGTAKPEFFEMDDVEQWEAKVEMSKLISLQYSGANKVACGRNKQCELIDLVIVNSETKGENRQPYWRYE